MSNTFIKLKPDDTKGDYRHVETGFYIHDVASIADVVRANGAIACDMTNGTWTWVAGEDLYLQIYRRGAATLRALAAALLSQKSKLRADGCTGGVYWSGMGASNGGAMLAPGVESAANTLGSDIRLFGIWTNAQAGRGRSSELLETALSTTNKNGWSTTVGIPGYTHESELNLNGSTPGSGWTCNPDPLVIGRVIIAIPLNTWGKFLSNWRSSVPNIDKAEVQAKVDAAMAKVQVDILPSMFNNPHIRVPFVLMSDGSVTMDNNPTMSVTKSSDTETKGIMHAWNALYAPTVCTPDGWYETNPFCPGTTTHKLPAAQVLGIGMNFLSPGGAMSGDSLKQADFTGSASKVGSIDGVPLFHILGGLCPRALTDPDVKTSTLVNLVGKNAGADLPNPTQGGTQSSEAYNTQLEQSLALTSHTNVTCAYGHWVMAGQVPMVVGDLLVAAMAEKSYMLHNLFYIGSGSINGTFRRADTSTILSLRSVDGFSVLPTMLRHQFAN